MKTKSNMTVKQKPKELDWTKTMKKSVSRTVKLTNILNSLKTIEDLDKLLIQQRTELESQKVKVVWNDVCEQIKQEARTELLEEIMKIIEVNVHVGSGYTDECDKNQLIEEIKKL